MENRFEPHEIIWTYEKASRIWDYYAHNPAYGHSFFSNLVGNAVIDCMLAYHSLRGNVLDYGCGQGFLLERLLKRGIACEGLDFSTDSLKIVEEKFENNPHFKGSTLAHGLPTPLTGDTFDVVFFIETIEHILPEDLNGTLQEIHRLLRKGGYIFVTTPNQENLEAARILCPECGCIFHRIQHITSWTKDSLSSVMKANGFCEVQCKPTRLKEDRWPESVLHWLKLLAHKLLKKPYPHLVYIGRK